MSEVGQAAAVSAAIATGYIGGSAALLWGGFKVIEWCEGKPWRGTVAGLLVFWLFVFACAMCGQLNRVERGQAPQVERASDDRS